MFWEEAANAVVRGSWFVRHDDQVRPFPEEHASMIEAEFQKGCLLGQWHRRVALPNSDVVVLRNEV